MEPLAGRRPLRSRDTGWAKSTAAALGRSGIRPNHISLASVAFGALAGLALWASGRQAGPLWPGVLWLAAAGGMQCRLLCNLFDGMVAVEGGFRTKSGEVYNELPDRFADAFIFVGAGYSIPGNDLVAAMGWMSAVLAVLTAYVRAMGAAAGARHHFEGPMAKQQRMACMTAGCVAGAIVSWLGGVWAWQPWVLGVVIVGSLATVARRVRGIVRDLESA